MRLRVLLTAAVLLSVAVTVHAQMTVSAEAFNNATVQPAGPRTGSGGKNFFNIEGNNNGQFASFGVADFNAANLSIGQPVADVVGIRLKLTEDRASFSAAGSIRFWLTEDTTTSIDPGTPPPMAWDASDLPNGLGTQLVPRYELGTGAYTPTADGTLFEYTLSLSSAAKVYLINQLNSAGTIRLIVSPADDAVAATYAGYSHSTLAGPTLELDLVPVPEPASLTALFIGITSLAGVAIRRKRA
ncbi:MAG: hypothetical protein KatS3mg023_1184 [Armatimonadota bacterium]|nr:MAG: hypothetical protein KatS3mg023_1184 [Armatimonadota bacterium]